MTTSNHIHLRKTQNAPQVGKQQNTHTNTYSEYEYAIDDSDISDIWTRDSNIWQVNGLYMDGTGILCMYIKCDTKQATASTHIENTIEQRRCHTYLRLCHKVNVVSTTQLIADIFQRNIDNNLYYIYIPPRKSLWTGLPAVDPTITVRLFEPSAVRKPLYVYQPK